jgi:hypothetical protein
MMATKTKVTKTAATKPVAAKSAAEPKAKAKAKVEPMGSETELCALFISEFNTLKGWTCYPEAAGFDILCVHEDGRQIGVEAKLTLNAKVAEQILPTDRDDLWGAPGPDHRIVIVSKITEASAGIARMLDLLGVKVLCPRVKKTAKGQSYTFDSFNDLREARTRKTQLNRICLQDWNPARRCRVPVIAEDAPAGVPCPVRLTPWKESAIKVIALMRKQGFITVKQISSHGISPTLWVRGRGRRSAWLAKGEVSGQWVETKHLPDFTAQHPALYEIETAKAA